MTDRVQLAAGRALGSRYELLELLGTGAMGAVWSALDRETGETTAAKVLHPQYSSDVNVVTRFVQERSILLNLRHPHIVRVRDLVVEGANLAIVMDLVRGTDLRKQLRAVGTMPAAEAVRLMTDVVDALATAHAAGVVHRDVKPDNILLDSAAEVPTALLSDFGVARLSQESQVRMSGLLGTADYMAPETFLDNEVGAATDIYSAGITLYELVAGRTPFAGRDAAANPFVVAQHHVNSLPPDVPGMPAGLAELIVSMLAKNPRHRPTAAEVVAELKRIRPALEGVAALAPLAAPDAWAAASAPAVAEPGSAPRAVPADPDGTMIGVARRATPNLPVEGAAPTADPVLADAPATQLGGRLAARPVYDVPDVAPASAAYVTQKKNPLALWLIGVGATVAVVAGAALVIPRLGGNSEGSGATTGAVPIAVEAQDFTNTSSGLQISRLVSFAEDRATVTVTWRNNGPAEVPGSFFEVVPGFDGECPHAFWRDVKATDERGEGLTGACGYSVTTDVLAPGQEVSGSYEMKAPEKNDDELRASGELMLKSIVDDTSEALSALSNSAAYPLQRFAGLRIEVGIAERGQTVPTKVYPRWEGDEESSGQVIYNSDAPDSLHSVVEALGGNFTLNADGCEGMSMSGERPPHSVGVPFPSVAHVDGCVMTAQLGAGPPVTTPFGVS